MKKTSNIIFIVSIVILFVLAIVFYNLNKKDTDSTVNDTNITFSSNFVNNSDAFSDGLSNPDSITQYPLDEFGTGLAEKSVYYVDINNDNKKDRITKQFIETGNAHSYYEYTVEINIDGKYVDITPTDFKTTNGAMCDLQQIQFVFKPSFYVTLIYRELGDTWNHPTVANKKTFSISGNKFKASKPQTLSAVCDVKELF